MVRRLTGSALEDFVAAVERAGVELDEAIALATMEHPRSAKEWAARSRCEYETLIRLTLAMADMTTAATGAPLDEVRATIAGIRG